MSRENVEPDRVFLVGWANQDHVLDTVGLNYPKELVHQITMRIKERHTVAVLNVLPDHVEQQGGFALATGTYDVRVAHALVGRKTNRCYLSLMNVFAQQQSSTRHGCSLGPRDFTGEMGNLGRRHVNEAEQFLDVEQHPGASTLAAHHVLDVVFKRILVIPQWDQFIAAGAGEGPKAGSDVAGNFPGPVKITGTGRDPDDRSMERVTDLLCQL